MKLLCKELTIQYFLVNEILRNYSKLYVSFSHKWKVKKTLTPLLLLLLLLQDVIKNLRYD